MLNKYNDNSDSGGDASSPNDCMEESQCVGKKDYSETTYTEEQNSQNERDYKTAGLTSNGRLKAFVESENVVNLYNGKLSRAEISLLSKGLKFCPTPNSVDK